ncbi:MAG: 30S ribosomal protein S8, partial [Roseimicrobium sp.]
MSVVTDPIADFLSRLKNASRAAKTEALAPFSRMKAEIARILQEEGYVWSYELLTP